MMALASRVNLAWPQASRASTVASVRRNIVCASSSSPTPKRTSDDPEVKKEVVGKASLVGVIAQDTGLSKAAATKALESVLSGISQAVSEGKRVTIVGFGTFERRDREARKGLNPKTMEPIDIAATKVPAFKPSPRFKAKVNGIEEPVKPKAASPAAAKRAAKPAAAKPKAATPARPSPTAPPAAAKKASPKNSKAK